MSETVDLLLAVQGMDLEMVDLLRQISVAKVALDGPPDVKVTRDELARAEEELRRLSSAQRAAEGDVQDLRAKLAGLEKRYKGDMGGNVRAITSLETEMAHRREQISAREDDIVELMVAIEQQEAQVRRLHDAAVAFEALHAGNLPTLRAAVADLEARAAALKARRVVVAGRVPPDALQVYRTLAASGKGKPVVRMVAGTCHGCGTTLPTAEAQRIRLITGLPRCPRCGHIVVVSS